MTYKSFFQLPVGRRLRAKLDARNVGILALGYRALARFAHLGILPASGLELAAFVERFLALAFCRRGSCVTCHPLPVQMILPARIRTPSATTATAAATTISATAAGPRR